MSVENLILQKIEQFEEHPFNSLSLIESFVEILKKIITKGDPEVILRECDLAIEKIESIKERTFEDKPVIFELDIPKSKFAQLELICKLKDENPIRFLRKEILKSINSHIENIESILF